VIVHGHRRPLPAATGAAPHDPAPRAAGATDRAPDAPAAGGRLPRWRAVLGWGVGVLVAVLVVRQGLAIDWGEAWARVRDANVWLLLLALAVFSLTYPVRAARWGVLLANAGIEQRRIPPLPELTGIVYRAAFVNGVGVARVGDVFRATLLHRHRGVSTGSALGTIVSERLLDLATLAVVVAVAAPFALSGSMADDVTRFSLLGLGLVLAAVAALWSAIRFRGVAERLVPARLRPAFARLLDAAAGSAKRLPLLVGASAAGWALEGASVFLIAAAVGVPLSLGAAVVVGLVAALLSAIPLTPSGLGFAEAGVGVLLVGLGVDAVDAAATVLLVRLVSYWSIVVGGGLAALARRSF
jgi:glycosyltransferase 2 family protein